jgi:peroxiredoxin Q/BCP
VFRVAAAVAVTVLLSACRGGAGGGSPSGSASGVVATPPPIDTSWERVEPHMLAAPARAPDFEGVAHTGMRVRLSAFRDKPAVVYFYSDDRSSEAASAARSFRDQWLRLLDVASMVLGVSGDDRVTHKELATAEKLPFLLVADEKNAIAKAFGVPVDNGRPRPVTFIVGKDGNIARVLDAVSPEGQADAVLRALEALP